MLWSQSLWAADGLDTWIVRTNSLSATNWLYSITYGNDQFVAVGGSQIPRFGGWPEGAGVITSSADGSNWVAKTIPGTRTLLGVTHAAGFYVAVGYGTVLGSLAGTSWTPSQSVSFSSSAVAYGKNMFVAGSGGYVYTSTNAVTWSRTSVPGFEFSFTDLAFGNGVFLAVGGHGGRGAVLNSTNGTTWSGVPSDYLVRRVRYGGGLYVAIGDKGTIKTSADTTTWLTRDSGTTNNILGVTFGGGVYVAVGSGGTILTSTDATTWTPRASRVTNDLTAIAYGNGRFVAVGANGTILESNPIIHLGQFTGLSSGAVQFTLSGPAKQTYQLQASTNLVNWIALTDTTLDEPSATIVIIAPTNFSQSFYRAFAP